MSSSVLTFPPVPPELKTLAPYFQRAQELAVKDAVMAYWCTYYAAKQGISLKAQNKDLRPFLFQVMGILEQMRANLGNNDAVSDFDAGAAYIEGFALRVFNSADNEDRREQATRSTAKKFLASANFFELLRIFDKPVEADTEEKIRYAKWKAADLAKAFREGRKPVPGDAKVSPSAATLVLTGLEPPHDLASSMSGWSPGTSLAPSPAVHSTKPLEQSSTPDAKDSLLSTAIGERLLVASGTEDAYQGNSYSEPAMSPNHAITLDHDVGLEREELDNREETWSTIGNQSITRQNSRTVFSAAAAATQGPQSQPSLIGLELQPDRLPPAVSTKKVHFSPSVMGGLSSEPSSVADSSPPELTSTEVAKIQKHCRFAISALDYEDLETARKELRHALFMLGD